MLTDSTQRPTAGGTVGSERLDFLISQVWGPAIDHGEARVDVGGTPAEGWETREEYVVIPTARSAQLLIPRNRVAASRSLTDYAGLRSPRTRIVRRVLGAAVAGGLTVSRDRLTVRAPAGAPVTMVPAVGEVVGCPNAVAALGVRTGANAKPTLELRTPEGNSIGFAKLAWNPVTTQAIENEARGLRAVAVNQADSAIHAPRLLADGVVHGRRYVMTEALPRSIADVPANWRSLHHDEAIGPGSVYDRRPLATTKQSVLVRELLGSTTDVTPSGLAAQAEDLLGKVLSHTVALPIADYCHGDFVPWNVGRDADGRLWLFDWETAQLDVPAGLDTLHWLTNTQGDQNPQTVSRRLESASTHGAGILRSLGYSRNGAVIAATWYALTLVAGEIRLAEALQSWERVKHPAGVLAGLLEWGMSNLMSVSKEERP